jgi:hypothetical protein
MKTKLFLLLFVLFSHSFGIAQSISSFTPSIGNAGDLINVTITGQGTNFQQGTDVIQLTSGTTVISPLQSTFVSPTSILSVFAFNKNNPTGYYNLSIQKYGTAVNLNNCFYLNADPAIASVNSITPSSAQQGETITMTINGLNSNFGNGGLPTSVWLRQGSVQISGTNIVVVDPLTIQATFVFSYGHPTGNYDVCFYNVLDGTVTDSAGFTLNTGTAVPSIVSCTPNSGTQCELLSISITGQHTNFEQGTDVITLTDGFFTFHPQQSTFVNDSLIQTQFVFTAINPTGYYDLSIQKWNSYNLTLNDAFYLNPVAALPSIVSVSPSSGVQNTVATLLITGVHNHFGQPGSSTSAYIKQGGYVMNQSSATIIDTNTLQVQIPLSPSYPTGLYDLYVNNTFDGPMVLTGSFTITPGINSPMITSVSPDSAFLGQTLTVSITGQNTLFEQGTDNINLSGNGIVIYPNNISFVSPTILNATFYFPLTLPTGFYNVNAVGNDIIVLPNGFKVLPYMPLTCSALFTLVPDSLIQYHYFILNNASGIPPISYLWSWGDGTFDSIDYPSHTYSTAGYYNICLSITDSTGCTSTYCDSSNLQKSGNSMISLQVIPGTILAINPNDFASQIMIYPNPATNYITIESPQQAMVEIFNMNGQVLETILCSNKKTTIDLGKLSPGIYITKVKTDKGIAVKKIIIR